MSLCFGHTSIAGHSYCTWSSNDNEGCPGTWQQTFLSSLVGPPLNEQALVPDAEVNP